MDQAWEIKKAVTTLKEGGIVIFPTDTAFAIGCRIDHVDAIERLFRIRKRPRKQATPVLVDTVKMAQDYLLPIPKEVIDKLIEPYWPGALTIVFSCKINKVPNLVRGGGNTLGVRIPNHPIARAIIRGVGIPILGPSANVHGEKTPYKMEDLNRSLIKQVDFVVDGKCPTGNVSTVVDCSTIPWNILRQGEIEIKNDNAKSKSKKTLLINTSSNKEIKVGLRIGNKEHWFRKEINFQKAQAVLPMIVQLIEKSNIKISDINGIEVNTGPGSFTGLRVGVSVANALAFALDIVVNGKKQVEHLYY